MTRPPAPRYLSAVDVAEAMPALPERLELAARTMIGLVADAEMPPKISVHPRPAGSFAHAMPAFLRGPAADGSDDRLGIKWVLGSNANAALGLPAIHGTVILNDATTGVPIAILDAGPITAERTAAVSGVAIRAFAPAIGRPPVVALIGPGVQGVSHVPVIGHLLPGARLRIHGRSRDRAEALARTAAATSGIDAATVAESARDAVDGADVVITAASFTTPDRRQVLSPDWLVPHALVVAVDYATYVSAAVARSAATFLVDDRPQFLANRAVGNFDGYPDPGATLGEALLAGMPRPAGQVLVTHLGVGLADVVFGSAILDRAVELGIGLALPR